VQRGYLIMQLKEQKTVEDLHEMATNDIQKAIQSFSNLIDKLDKDDYNHDVLNRTLSDMRNIGTFIRDVM